MNETETILKLISGILLRSFIAAMALLILWILMYFVIGDFWYITHTRFFDFTEQEFRLLNYGGMGLFKILAVCFLLSPFVAIELVIRTKKYRHSA